MSQQQVDVAVVVRKLQDRLGEALTTIAILEAQIDQMNAANHEVSKPAAPEVAD
jgi:hypothetical protein